ncbi:OmpH family outer membrane protein [Cognatishimia sp. WU-CL00825]|uniref:OmpH family outer membrane protein n=1 Tax=Cognatishimia sp. WU-CL00825 TaxID=3127658 RepID=UPI00310ABB21
MPKLLSAIIVGVSLLGLTATFALGQQARGVVSSPILIIDSQRLYAESAFGQRVQREQEASIAILSAENRKIEAELAAEELQLTEKRSAMVPANFRKVADAFDLRVQDIRDIQDGKEVEIARAAERERARFFQSLGPVMDSVLRESGAVLIMEKRSTFAHSQALLITDLVLARINQTLGDGAIEPIDDADDAAEN